MDSVLTDNSAELDEYRKHTLRKVLFIIGGLIAVVLVMVFSVTIGGHDIDMATAFQIIWDKITGVEYEQGSDMWWDSFIVWEERLPRIFAAALSGAALSVAGVAMQAILKNPLADPYTTGISSGAMVGVAAAITLGLVLPFFSDELGLMLNAFVMGIIPALVIVGITRMRNVSPATIVLAGLAMSFMFGAITQLIMMGTEAEKSQEIYKWMVGTLNYVVSDKIPLMALITVAGTAFFLVVSKQLNQLSLGDVGAKSLGLDVDRFRNLCLLVMSFMIAEQVSVTGVLGFVGLVVPHMVRMMIGVDNRYLVPASMLVGALFVLVSDIIARTILDSISVGVVLSFIGGPTFLAMII
ncbi:MAG: iron ABC transporter permease, partial [Candidatus Methanomethylophilaceae archaeon]|nr:iron ABC transporter permease [Candidatus Methanomethylophilaceae archaeon]